MALDPTDYAVSSQVFIAAAREMGEKLIRSAFDHPARTRDGSAALLDRDGNTIARAELIPMQFGTIGSGLSGLRRGYDLDSLTDDDFFIINDPYSGGQHLQDIFFFNPIFHDGVRVGSAASVAHHLISGAVRRGLARMRATCIPKASSCRHGSRIAATGTAAFFEKFLRANVRAPLQTMGDCDAQIAANRVGARRVGELCAKYGAATVMG